MDYSWDCNLDCILDCYPDIHHMFSDWNYCLMVVKASSVGGILGAMIVDNIARAIFLRRLKITYHMNKIFLTFCVNTTNP